MAGLRLYDSFDSWKDFHDAVQRHLQETSQPMTKASSKKVESQNKSCKEPYPLDMVYYYQSYQCCHRGKFKPKGSGLRVTKSHKEGCSAKIQASLDKKHKHKIVVTIMDARHNHGTGEQLYKRYPKNRCLKGDEKELAEKLSSMNVPNKDLRRELQRLTGKSVTLQDVHNVKSAFRRKQKETLCGGERLNVAQMLHRRVEARWRTDPGLTSDMGVSETGELQYIYVQTSHMKESFEYDLTLGAKLIEGKTKIVHDLANHPGLVHIESKDRISAGDGARIHDMAGKAKISTSTATAIFQLLNDVGVKTHFIKQEGEKSFIAHKCHMIPLECVTRRVATGSFLRRNVGVKEGYRFNPPKLETFYKDDANHDPQWSFEQCVANKLTCGGLVIGKSELEMMGRMTVNIFEILERAWASLDCSLIDMKIEFGVKDGTNEIILGDIIDSDSWRLWPAGDRRLMKDKQVYRELKEVTPEALDTVKRNFEWIAERVLLLNTKPRGRAVVLMGSPSDAAHGESIRTVCKGLGVPCELRVTSAHKQTEQTMRILAEYEGEGIPTVFIAVAGRSNGLGPVLSGNAVWPVINCPPVKADWGAQDVWSSLRMPSGLGCATVLSPEAAGLAAAQSLALTDHVIWAKLRAKQMNTWISLTLADQGMRDDK